MKKSDTYKSKVWNFIFSIIFIVALVLFGTYLQTNNISVEVGIFEFVLLALASFRLIRLVVYDKVFAFFRDFFTVKEPTGCFATIKDMLGCPWCFGIWGVLITSIIYFAIPMGDYFILIMAIAGVATLFQLFANLIGWHAQHKKYETQLLEKKMK